ncbi:MAG: hypothetical protein Q8Q86_02265 [Candidatus Daviesbacteria bacterium]|nr:hypothetical protein [Candidatus Daviesbacteria bacterium]
MEYLSLIPATALGYLTLRVTTHPTSRIRRKMPNIKTGRVQIFPVLRFKIFGRVIHLHHWVSFSIVLGLSFFISMGVVDYIVTKGILLGGIIHGLTVPRQNRQIIYKNYSLEKMIALDKNTSHRE